LPGGKRLFFVEAKKPSVLVKEDIIPSYQVRRYGWSAKLPISLVTDFEEFAIYDCTKKPDPADKASTARIKYITYKNYLEEFDFIWNTFSKQSVLKGSFDKFIISDTHKKGTATVDKEFLRSLDEWRKLLAQNIALRNQNLTEDELNFVVQQTIDRIIFLRIAEDRGVEGYGELKEFLKPTKEEGSYFKELFKLFKEADSKYNSGLFDFKKDALSANITIDNKIIKNVISELYYPECPYEFSVLGVEILGSAYEQFLGKQIKLDKNHRAVIEEKPEVRKAGGVYYTPQYIVDYIVENTVGKLTESKTPEQVAELKIVDPACGSGSFLIGAYKYLLTWHLNYYKPEFIKHSESAADTNANTKTREAAIKHRNKLPLTPEGNLTTALKKQILLNNIYGVDIDTQAVEVTKLSLLLKCMEGETGSSINAVMHFGERVLPTLDNNIKSGNSLIDVDFYDTEFDFGEENLPAGKAGKIKPFNWEQAFPNVFKQGGFDAVIGNPPYVQLSADLNLADGIKKYLISKYKSSMGRLNTFGFFTKKAIDLIKVKSLIGFILPNTITTQDYYEELRKMILDDCAIDKIVNFDKLPFKDAIVENIVLVLRKKYDDLERKNNNVSIISVDENEKFNLDKIIIQRLFLKTPKNSFNITINPIQSDLKLKIEINTTKLGELLYVNQAIALKSDRTKWVSDKKKNNQHKPLLVGGKNINRYSLSWDGIYLNYNLEGIHSCKREDIFLSTEKILFRRVANRLIATLDTNQFYALHTIVVMNLKPDIGQDIRFFLGLFNSTLINYYYKITFASTKTIFSEIGARQVQELPIKKIDSKDDKKLHDEVVKHVETMLELNKQKQTTTLPEKLEQLNQRMAYTDDKINKLVYELYGLTPEEINIVEGNG
jgi:type I restriction-modification system DNA methylase subunit